MRELPVRVLVTSTPGRGHATPIAPLALAMQAAGDDVLWATADDGVAFIQDLGLPVVAAGMTVAQRRQALAPDMPRIMAMGPRERRAHLFAGFFARSAAPMMFHALRPIIDEFQPQVVVHETAELAAAPLAEARGVPHVSVAFSGPLPPAGFEVLTEQVSELWHLEGLDLPRFAGIPGDLYLHPFPPLLGDEPPWPAQPMRPGTLRLDGPADAAPPWMHEVGGERPAIYVTFGTEPTALDAPWAAILEAIAAHDVDAVLTIGPHVNPDSLPSRPENVRLERFIPQHLLLERVSLVVSHAGAGTMLGAAVAGVPQLVLPMFADQWENADAIAHSGAAVLCEPDDRSAESLGAAIGNLLTDSRYGTAAQAVASQIRDMPPPEAHLPAIVALADGSASKSG